MSETMINEETTDDAKSMLCPKCGAIRADHPADDGGNGEGRCLECGAPQGDAGDENSGEEINAPREQDTEIIISAEDLSEQEDAVEDGDPDEQLMAVREGLARDEETPVKVTPEPPPAKKPRKKGVRRGKKAEIEERLDGVDPASLPPYRTSDSYQVDDYFNHPKFGVGQVVEMVEATKIQVVFRDGKRLMLHARH